MKNLSLLMLLFVSFILFLVGVVTAVVRFEYLVLQVLSFQRFLLSSNDRQPDLYNCS